jgi:RNA polymerase sigma-70 factor, ECF subfamily
MTAREPAGPLGKMDSTSLVERHRPAIFRYVLRLVRDRAQSEDLTQETFLRAHQRLDDLRDPAAVESWLYRIASNVCYDWFRQAGYRHQMEPLVVGDDGDEGQRPLPDEERLRPDQLLEQNGMSECVLRFLARLPAAQRTVLLLHDMQGYTDPEIAAELGLSLENVKIRLHRARVRLKSALTAGCDFSRSRRGVLVCDPKSLKP